MQMLRIQSQSILYSNDIERSVDAMCNASQGIKNEAMRQGLEKGKIEAYLDMGLSADEISKKWEYPKIQSAIL